MKKGALIAFDDGSIDEGLVGTPWRRRDKRDGKYWQVANEAGLVSYPEAQRVKENYLARLRQLEFEVKSGRLVEAATVEAAMFKRWRAERDALLALPSRIAPLIAAQFKTDQVALTLELERHIRSYLEERSDPELRPARRH